jgi:hypothetical protein
VGEHHPEHKEKAHPHLHSRLKYFWYHGLILPTSTHRNGFCVIRTCMSSSPSPTKRKPATPNSPRGFKDSTHTSAMRHPRLRTLPHRTLTFCALHVHPFLPTATAFVPHWVVLARVYWNVKRKTVATAEMQAQDKSLFDYWRL